MISKENPLIPKNPGGPLKVIVIGRLSKPKPTEDETQRTIESSLKNAQEYLAAIYKGSVECRCLGEQISGMVVERVAIMETYELVQTGEWDLVLVEELRCVYRNPRFQYAFVQNLVDLDQRFISVADNLDTGDENWETQLAVAAVRHGLVVPDTRRRMRRTAKYVFHGGGLVLKVRYGYRKLSKEEAKSGAFGPPGLREAKVPEATPVWQEIRRRLIETQIPTAVVDWLNEQGIQPGPYVELGKWTVANLKGAACDPKLHGTRLFRRMIHTRIFGTGCFKRQPNPDPEKSYVPELAHMTLEEQTSMLAAVGWELDWGNRVVNWPSPRRGVPRYKSLWPGYATQCFACKGRMIIDGDHLRCPRCKKVNGRSCWNRVQVPLDLMRKKVHAWLMEQMRIIPKARNVFVDAAWGMLQERRRKTVSSATLQQKEIDRLQAECAKLIAGIKIGGNLESLVAELAAVEQQLKKEREKMSQKDDAVDVVASCGSKEDVESRMAEVLWYMMNTSYEFNDVMRRFFPEFIIQPVQAIDSGQVHPRGKLRFQAEATSAEFPDGHWVEVVMDFFEPPVHIGLLPQISEERSKVDPKTGRVPSYKKIADKVGTSYMTVKRAIDYSRLMEAEGSKDPFRELTEPPRKASRWLTREKPRSDEAA